MKRHVSIRRTVALGAILTTLLVGSGTAQALPYDGTDPVSTGCDRDARTVRYANFRTPGGQVFGVIELRYSPRCRTAWARVVHYQNDCVPGDQYCGNARVIRNSDRRTERCSIEDFVRNGRARRSCYTPQVNDAGVTSYASGTLDSGLYVDDATTGSYVAK